jgi:hypothetical protein
MTSPSPDPSSGPLHLRQLRRLVGKWKVALRWSEATHRLAGGPREIELPVEIRWLATGPWLYYEFGPAHWLIGGDEEQKEFAVLYSDDRPVFREYRMTLRGDLWKIWRDAPRFRQRFEGRLENHDRRIVGHWDKREDGGPWALDFELRFERSGPASRRP